MKIFIGNLHANASEVMLRDLFNQYGEVISVTIVTNAAGNSEGYGYIEMEKDESGREAIRRLNKINFMNQFLDIYEAGKPKSGKSG